MLTFQQAAQVVRQVRGDDGREDVDCGLDVGVVEVDDVGGGLDGLGDSVGNGACRALEEVPDRAEEALLDGGLGEVLVAVLPVLQAMQQVELVEDQVVGARLLHPDEPHQLPLEAHVLNLLLRHFDTFFNFFLFFCQDWGEVDGKDAEEDPHEVDLDLRVAELLLFLASNVAPVPPLRLQVQLRVDHLIVELQQHARVSEHFEGLAGLLHGLAAGLAQRLDLAHDLLSSHFGEAEMKVLAEDPEAVVEDVLPELELAQVLLEVVEPRGSEEQVGLLFGGAGIEGGQPARAAFQGLEVRGEQRVEGLDESRDESPFDRVSDSLRIFLAVRQGNY